MRSILVTGGTGFFGRHFVRFLLDNTSTERICVYSRGEYTQSQMRASFTPEERERLRFFVGDVRDPIRLMRAMQGCDAVVHAAALKRIEVGEYCPDEMVKTNVHGVMNVIDAAIACKPSKVVFLSSDKACQPSSAYGATKLLGEKLILSAHHLCLRTRFAVTRYGNVAGSTGSVIPTWIEQIKRGQPITVSDSNVTRFWMSASRACEMVYMAMTRTLYESELIVPDLSAYKLGDLAIAVAVKYGDVNTITEDMGLSSGEKLHESMIGDTEAFYRDGLYFISNGSNRFSSHVSPFSSCDVERLTVEELKGMV